MNMDFGIRLKKLTKEKGISQKELAVKLGKNDQTISRWVNGESAPDAFDIIEICRIMRINANDLFGQTHELDPKIIDAIRDPVAVQALLITYKNKQDVKDYIKAILECLPNLSAEKRQALLALCK